MKELEARIVRRVFRNGDGLAMLRHPARNALPNAQFQAVDNHWMRVFGSTKNKFIAFENVDEAGVALNQGRREFNNAGQNIMKSVRRTQTDSDFVEYIYV